LTFSGATSSTAPVTTAKVTNSAATDIAFGTTTALTFASGAVTTNMKLYNVETALVAVTDGAISAAGADRLSVAVSAAAFNKLAVSLTSPQTNGTAFTGTNTLTAQDAYGNTVTGFAANTNNVTVTTSLTGTVSGLGSGVNNVLNQAGDFTSGVANLTSLGLKFTGTSGAGTFTFTPASGTAATSSSVTINAGAATKLVVTGTGTQTAGGSQTVTVTAQDANGNTATTYTGAKNITFSGAAASPSPTTTPTVAATTFGTATSLTFTAGVASGSMVLYKAESATVNATDGTINSNTGGTLNVTVSPASVNKFGLNLAVAQTNAVNWTGVNTLTAQDTYGNTVSSFDASANSVTVTNNLGGVVTGLGSGSTNVLNQAGDFTSGVANLTSLGIKYTGVTGTGTFTFTSTTGGITGSDVVLINAGAASRLVITGNNSQTAGDSQSITITAKDGSGNTDINYSGSKSLTFSGAASSISPVTAPTVSDTNFGTATSITFTNGVGTANLKLYKAESALVSATDGSISSTGGDRLGITVGESTFTKLAVSLTSPQTNGTAFTGTNTLTAQDAYGNAVTNFSAVSNNVTVTSSLTGAVSGFSGGNVMSSLGSFVDGVANLSSVMIFTGTSGSGTFTFTPATGTAVTSSSVTINPGAATKLVVTGTGTQTAGGSQTVTVTAKDASGNTATSYTGAKNITFSGAASSTSPATAPTVASTDFGTATSLTFTAGVASGSMILYKAESATVNASDGTINSNTGGTLNVTVSPSTMTKLAVSLTSPQVNGTAFTGTNTLTAQDAYGNTVTGFDASGNNITVTTSLTGTVSGLGSGVNNVINQLANFSSGVANLTSLGLKFTGTSGTGTFTFTPASGTAVTSSSVTVNPGAATKLVVTGTGTQTAGGAQTVTVTAKDANGNTVTSYTGAKNITFSGAAASPSPATTPTVAGTNFGTATSLTFTAGVASGSMVLYKAESATVNATDGTINSNTGGTLNVTVSPESFSKLAVSLISPQVNGTAFTGTNTLTAQDTYGNTVTSFDASGNNITVTTSLTGTVSGLGSGVNNVINQLANFTSGVANLTSLGLKFTGTSGAGTFTFTPATGTAVTSGSVTINAGAATKLVVTGTGTETAGSSQTVTVTAQDANGNTATTYTGAKNITFSGAAASPSPATNPTVNATNFGTATSLTFTAGVASGSMILYKAESATVNATDGTINSNSGGTLAVTVSESTMSKIAVNLASTQTNGVAFTGTNDVSALDAYGNLITNFDVSQNHITVTTNLNGAITGFTGVNVLTAAGAFVNGSATVSTKMTYTGEVGTGTFTFTPASGTAATSGNVTILPGAATKLVITGSATQTAGGAQTITITAKDGSGNVATGYTGSKSLTFSGANNSLSPSTVPTVGGINFGSTTNLTFTDGVATASMVLFKAESASVAVTDGAISAAGADRLAVAVSATTFNKLAVSLTSPQINGTAFTGTNTLTAQDAYGNTVTGFDASGNNITVTTSLTGTISGLGSGVNNVINQLANFSSGVANLTSLGLKFTGTSGAGTFTFTPASGTAVTSSSITVNPGEATRLVVTGTGTQTAGGSQTVTITAKDANGNTVTSYAGAKSITISGANNSINPSTAPTFASTNFGTVANLTFTAGVASGTMILYKAESATISANDGTISSTGGDRLSVTVSSSSLAKFSADLSGPQINGSAWTGTNTLTAQDAYGNTVNYNANSNAVTVTNSLGGVVTGLGSGTNNVLNQALDFVNGVADLSALGLVYTGVTGLGTFTFTSNTGAYTGNDIVVINSGAATKLVVTGTGTQTAGGSQTITVTAKDASGNTATTYTGAKNITFSGANSSSSPATAPTVADTDFGTATSLTFTAGVATGSMALYKAESAMVNATDGTINSNTGGTLNVTVSPSTMSKLAVSLTSPQVNGTAFTGTNTLTAQDAYGNTVTSFSAAANTITVSTTLTGAISGLSGTNVLNNGADFTSGVANLTSLGLKFTGTSGSGTFTFTPTSGTAVTSSSVTVNPGAATKLVVTGTGTQTAGGSQTVTVTAKDASGNTATSYTGAKNITFSGAASSTSPATAPTVASTDFGTATSLTFTAGVASGTMILYKAESATVNASDGTINSNTGGTLNVTVSPSTMTKLAVSLTSPQVNGTAFTGTNTLTAQDAYGNTVTGFDASGNNITVTTSLTGTVSGLGSGVNNVINQLANFSSGVANLTSLGLKFTGTSGTGTFTFTPASGTAVTSSSVTINPGAATKLVVTGTGTQTAGGAQTVTVTAKDADGNTVTSYTGAKNITFSGAAASPSPATTPTVAGTNFGTATSLTFTAGVASGSMVLYKAESATVNATDGTINSNTGGTLNVTVSPSTLDKFAVSFTSPQTNGVAFTGTNTITAQDAYGNTVTSFNASTDNITATTNLTGVVSGLSGGNVMNSVGDFVNGVANVTGQFTFTGTIGTGTATFTSASGKTGSANGDIVAGTATKLVVTGTGTQTAGGTQSITITAKDQSGNTALTYTGDKSLTFSGGNSSSSPVTAPTVTDKNASAVNFGTATVITFSNGVATANLKLYKAESAVVSTTDGSISSTGGDRLSVTVTEASFSKLAVSLTSPQINGTAFTGTNTVTAQDAYGNTFTSFDASQNNVTVTTSLSGVISGFSGGGGTTMQTAGRFVNGVADISTRLTYTGTAGTGTFTFTPASGTAVTSGNVVINSGEATKLVVTGSGTQTAGGSQTITVTAKDASGNTATGYTGSHLITFTGAASSPSPVTVPTVAGSNFGTEISLNFSNGVATASMVLYKAEVATITAVNGIIVSAGADRLSVTVSPAAYAKLTTNLATPQVNGVAFTGTNTLEAEDAYGNTVTSFDASANNVTVTTTLTGAISGLSGTNKLTSAGDFVSGIANLTNLGLKYTGAVGTGTFTFTPQSGTAATSGSVSISAGAATKLVVTGTASQTAGNAQTISITAKDAQGNTATGYTGSHTITFSGATSSTSPATAPTVASTDFGTGTSLNFSNGVATASLVLYKAESAIIDATDGTISAGGVDRLSVTVTENSFSKLAVSLASPQVTGIAFTGTNTLTAQDAYGNTITSFNASGNNITVSTSLTGSITGLSGTNKLSNGADFSGGVANLTSLGLTFTGNTGTGTFTFTPATGTAVTSSNVTVNAGAATKFILTGTSTLTAGGNQTVTITAKDAQGNTATGYTGDKSIVFSGANSSINPSTAATARDKDNADINFGTVTVITFSNGVGTALVKLYRAETAQLVATQGGVTTSGSDRLTVTVSPAAYSKLAVSLATPQVNGTAFTGTNTLTAQDTYGNTVPSFDASANNVTVSTSLTGAITGLSGTNKLSSAGDFTSGVANLTSQLIFTGTVGTGTFTFTPQSGAAVTSGSVQINSGAATKLVVTGSSSQTAGGSQTISITAKDASGNTATGYTGSHTITFSGANSSSSPATAPTVSTTDFGTGTSLTFTNGVATAAMVLYKAESALVAATDGTISAGGADRLSVNVSATSFSKLAVSLASPQVNGSAFTGTNTLTAQDAYGNSVTNFNASGNIITVSTTLTGGISGLSGTDKLNNAADFSSGVADLTSLGLIYSGTVGTGTFTFTPASGTAVTSGNVTINSGAATKFIVTGTGTLTAGGNQTITITAKDASGNTATGYTGDKSIVFSGANSSINPSTAATARDKDLADINFGTATVVTFSNGVGTALVKLYKAETALLVATQGGVTTSGSDRLSVVVSTATLNKLAVSLASPQTNGTAFTGTNTLTAQDAYGNTVTTFAANTNNVTVTSTLTGTISGLGSGVNNVLNQAGDFSSGVANLTSLGLKFTGTVGTGTFSFATATGGATGTSANVTINPGSATRLVITGTSTITAGTSQTITLTAKDAEGNTVTSYTGVKALTFSGADASHNPATAPTVGGVDFGSSTNVTFTNGVATASMILYEAAVANVVANDGSISSSGADRLTVTVNHSTLNKFEVSFTTPQTSGVAFTGVNTITAEDAYGNAVLTFDASANNVTASTSLGGAITGLSGTNKLNSNLDFVNGVADLTGKLIYTGTSGSGTITFTSTTGGATGSFNGVINPGTATKFIITGNNTEIAGNAQTITITAKDASGNTATAYTGTKSLTFTGAANSINPSTVPTVAGTDFGTATNISFTNGVATASMVLYKAETVNVVATQSSITTSGSDRLGVLVSAATFSKLVVSLTSPQTNGVAFTGTNTLTAQDAYGNTSLYNASTNPVTVTTSLTGTISGLLGTNILNSAGDFTAGVANLSSSLIFSGTAGTGTFTFTPTTGTAVTSSNVTIGSGAATKFVITGTGTQVAGATQTMTITAKDANGNTAIGYTGNHALTFSGASSSANPVTAANATDNTSAAIDFGTATTIAFTNGVATSDLKLYKVETANIAASASGINASTGSDRLTVVVSHGVATKFTVSLASPQNSGTAFTGTNTLTAYDAYGNVATTFNASANAITVTSSLTGTVSGLNGSNVLNNAADFSSGIANLTSKLTFTGTAGTGTFTFTPASGTPVTSGNVTMGSGAATRLVVTGTGTQTAGSSQTITVTAKDASGNTVTTYTGDHAITFAGAASSSNPVTVPTVTDKTAAAVDFATATTMTFTSGVATGSMTLYKVESPFITASASGISASTGGDRLSVTVSPSTGLKFTVSLATPQTSGQSFTGTNTLTAYDSWGNVATGFNAATNNITVSTTLTGTITGLTGTNKLNNVSDFTNGVSSVSGLTFTGNAGTGTFTFTPASGTAVTSSNVTINAGTVSKLVITGSGTQTAGVAQTITITAKDADGNTVSGYAGDKTLTFSGASSSVNPVTAPTVTNKNASAINLGSNTIVTFTNGVGTASMILYKAESALVSVTDGTVSSSSNGDKLSVAVSGATASKLVATTLSPSYPTMGSNNVTLNALVQDPYGNQVNVSSNTTIQLGLTIGGVDKTDKLVRTTSGGVLLGNPVSVTINAGSSSFLIDYLRFTESTRNAPGYTYNNNAIVTTTAISGMSLSSSSTGSFTITEGAIYQPTSSGNWTAVGWEVSTDGGNSFGASSAPTQTSQGEYDIVKIPSGITTTLNTNIELYSLIIDGVFDLPSGNTLTLKHAVNPAAEYNIHTHGTFKNSGGTFVNTLGSELLAFHGGTYEHARNGGSIPASTWSSNAGAGTHALLKVNGITTTALTGGLDQNFMNVEWNNASQSVTQTLHGNISVSQNFNLASGDLAIGSNTLTLDGSMSSITGNLLGSSSSNLVVNTTSGTPTFSFKSGSRQLGNLTVNTSSGIALDSDVLINGTLTFQNGKVVTNGANILSLSNGASISGAGSAKYVQGKLARGIPQNSSAVDFPIGDSGNYAPLSLSFAGRSGNLTITTSTAVLGSTPAVASGISQSKYINRFWIINDLDNTSGTYTSLDATMNYVGGDVQGSANTAAIIVRKKLGDVWSIGNAGTRTSTSVQSSGFTSLGDFYAGETAGTNKFVLNAPANIAAGTRAAYTVSRRDIANLSNTVGAQTVYLYSTGGTFHSTANNGVLLTSVTIADGDSVANFWYRHTVAGNYTITVSEATPSANGATGILDASDNITVNPASVDAAVSTLLPTSASITADGASTQVLTVRAKDEFGNNITSGGATVTITKLSGTGTISAVSDGGAGTYTATVTAASASGSGVFVATIGGAEVKSGSGVQTEATVTYVPGSVDAAISTLTPTSASITADGITTQTLTVTAKDANGNNIGVGGATVTITKLSGSGSIGTVSDAGNGNYTAIVTSPTTAGSGVFVATIGGIAVKNGGGSQTQSTITFAPGAATKLVVTGTGTQTAGGTQTITVTAKDANGNTATTYTGSHSITFSGAASSLSPSTAPTVAGTNFGTGTSLTFTDGVATASLRLYKAEAATVSATDGTISSTGGDRLSVTVSPSTLSKFAVELTSPQINAVAWTGVNTVTAQDAYGNTVTTFDASQDIITVTGVPAVGVVISGLSGGDKLNSASDFVNGVSNLTNKLTLTGNSGTGALVFTSASGATGTDSGDILPGDATKFVITGNTTQTAGGSQTITVTAKDVSGNTATGYTGNKSITFSGAASSASPATAPTVASTNFGTATTLNFSNGVANASMSLYKAESAVIVATQGAITTSGSDRLSVSVSATDFSKLAVSLTSPQVSGVLFTGTNNLTALDAYGNTVTTFNAALNHITVTTSLSGTISGFVGGDVILAAERFVNGVADISGWMRYSGTAGTGTFTFTPATGTAVTSSSITINAGTATKLVITGNANQTAGASQTITVTAKDAQGNTATSYTGAHSITFSGANSSLSPSTAPTVATTDFGTGTSLTFTNGVATAAMVLYKAESAFVAATDGTISAGGADRLAVAVTATSFSKLAVSLASPQVNGTAFTGTNTLTAQDAYGNTVTSFNASGNNVTVTTSLTGSITGLSGTNKLNNAADFSSGIANLTSLGLTFTGTSGSGTFTFSPATGTAVTSSSVTVSAGEATKLVVTGTGTQTAGGTQTITVTAKDANGNTAATYTGTKSITFSGAASSSSPATAPTVASTNFGQSTSMSFSNGVATATMALYKAESATIAATDGTLSAGGSDRLSVTVSPAAYSKLAVSLATPQVNATAFTGTNTLTAQDAYGNTVSSFDASANNVTVTTSLTGTISGLSGANKLSSAGDFTAGVA
ncbi:invasin domain 3-containing protein, partial [Aquirufa aurantiipilula]